MLVCIDPGHGGGDPGCVNNGIKESDYVLDMAFRVHNAILARDSTAQVRLTRSSNVRVSFSGRGRTSAGCDAVVCLHVNSADPSARGLRLFHYPGNTHAVKICDAIVRKYPEELNRHSKHIAVSKTDWTRRAYTVVTAHKPTAVLVELGFSSNVDDARLLQDETVKRGIAEAIAQAML